MSLCPCGSGEELIECCGRYLDGVAAPTCETLMRSRYSAYLLGDHGYLVKTWHPTTCPERLSGMALKWIGLEIVGTGHGLEHDEEGIVEFVASFCNSSGGKNLHEISRFIRVDGLWVYLDGRCSVSDIGRDDLCPCGGGKKFKQCCGEGC